MSTVGERRATNATRIPFEAIVEIGGALGPTFEAEAVDLSHEGMHLRTAYLPEVGQEVRCTFDAGSLGVISAVGEVLWNEDMGRGGEFGLRFVGLDETSAQALDRILQYATNTPIDAQAAPDEIDVAEEAAPRTTASQGQAPHGQSHGIGTKIRLHIDGLAGPMSARVKAQAPGEVTAYSDLGFLEVGRALDLEDTTTGERRAASIDGVDVEMGGANARMPQLVVKMRYADAPIAVDEAPLEIEGLSASAPPASAMPSSEIERSGIPGSVRPPEARAKTIAKAATTPEEEEALSMKSAFARKAAEVGPALTAWAWKTRARASEWIAKRKGGTGDDVAIPLRKKTSPPPTGALHANGRKVVRADVDDMGSDDANTKLKVGLAFARTHKRRIAIGSAIGLAGLLAILALRKPHTEPLATLPADKADAGAIAAAEPEPVALPADTITAQGGAAKPTQGAPIAQGGTPVSPNALPLAPVNDTDPLADELANRGKPHKKGGKVAPWGNGPVSHANVLRLRMDGPIDTIQGASSPTGFTVVVPSRRSVEAASPLATKDPRIAQVQVQNEGNRSELTMTFKDGVPNYQVRARGEVLEILLNQPATTASAKDEPAPHGGRHAKSNGKKKSGKHSRH